MLELKYNGNTVTLPVSPDTTNRTMLELKYSCTGHALAECVTTNRTMLELKFEIENRYKSQTVSLLIAPCWN